MDEMARQIAALSDWVDESEANRDRSDEAKTWGRVAKVAEECGEAVAALIGATGQNPRKGVTHTMSDVREELLDVALTALGAVEHLDRQEGLRGTAIAALRHRVAEVWFRAGQPGL